ncbi:hypothetical protein ACFL1U_02895 [Patescibacteria group bacterium]
MNKTNLQYVRITVAGVILVGLIITIIFTVRHNQLLKVSVIRPYREDPTQAVIIQTRQDIPVILTLSTEESLLWENQTGDETIQILAKEFASQHLSPEEAYQIEFKKPGVYFYEVTGLDEEKISYQIIVKE